MFGVGWMIKNQNDTLSPIKLDKFDTYEEAFDFYTKNKSDYRDKGIYLTMVDLKSN